MTTCKQGPGVTHHGGCPCWEARQAEELEWLDNLVRLARDATRRGTSLAWSEWLDMLYVYEDDNGLPHERED